MRKDRKLHHQNTQINLSQWPNIYNPTPNIPRWSVDFSHTHQHCLSPRSPTPPTGQWTSYTHPTDNAWAHDSQHYPLDRLKGLGRGTCNTPNARRRCCSLAFLRNSEGVSDMGRRSVSLEGKDSCSSLSFRIVSLVWQWMHLDQIQHPEECLWQLKKLWVTIFSLQCLSYVFDDGYVPRNQWSVLMMEFHEFLFSLFDGKITVPYRILFFVRQVYFF